jgi:DNA invertase Pin-like site-specific DNA recombinase
MLDVVQTLVSLLDRGIHIKTLDGALDTKAMGSVAPLVVSILGYVAQVEADLIRERTRENYEHRRRTGGKLGGRPRIPSEKQELAIRLRSEGMSIRRIAASLGISSSAVHRLVSSAIHFV